MDEANGDAPVVRLLDGAFYAGDARRAYAWLRRNAPVFKDATSGIWAIASWEGVRAAEVDPVRSRTAGVRGPRRTPCRS